MLKVVVASAALSFAICGGALAQTCTITNTFSNGSTADAIAFNTNFTNLANCAAPIHNPTFTGYVSLGTGLGGWAGTSIMSVQSTSGWTGSFYAAAGSAGTLLLRTDSVSAPHYAYFYFGGSTVGEISTNGTSVSYYSVSDYRLKTNIESDSSALERLMKLQPKRFNWKSSIKGAKTEGFLAHEVQDVVPDAVSGQKDAVNPDGSIKPQMIDYSKLVPLLVAAVKEEQGEIEQLKAQLATLKSVH